MPITPDRFPGALEEDEEVIFAPTPGEPSVAGAVKYNGADFQMRDASGVFNPRVGGEFDLGRAIVTVAGGLVYDTSGQFVTKATS
jgi:hypothetical protein